MKASRSFSAVDPWANGLSFKGIEKLSKTQKREGDLKLAVDGQFYHVISVVARWRRCMSGWFG